MQGAKDRQRRQRMVLPSRLLEPSHPLRYHYPAETTLSNNLTASFRIANRIIGADQRRER